MLSELFKDMNSITLDINIGASLLGNWSIFGQIGLKIGRKLVNFSRNFSGRISREKCLAKPFLVLARNARNVQV